MIIACPECQTRYVVPDNAIGVEGRTVRCAKCKHSWFQDGASAQDVVESEAVAKEAAPAPPPLPSQPEPETSDHESDKTDVQSEAPVDDEAQDAEEEVPPPPASAFEDPEPKAEAPSIAEPVDDYEYDDTSRFDYEPPFKPRRNPLKIWTAAGVLFATLAVGTMLAVSYWGMPSWLPVERPTFALQEPDLELDFPAQQMDRRTLANGTEYFGTRGTVTNTGRETRDVPPILIVLRDQRDRIVYSWEVSPPKRNLAPGESVRINEAVTDVPPSAAIAEIGWKPR